MTAEIGKGKGKLRLKNLEQLRTLHGMTLEDVATKMDISKSYMHYLEKGQRRLYTENAEKMAKIYNVDVGIILKLYNLSKKASDAKSASA